MANLEQLDILRQVVETWNQWRKEHPEIQPDLSNTDMNRADLRNVNFKFANLSDAGLSEANLREANFYEADLSKASLYRADLWRADLRRANFWKANLSEAQLHDANFNAADLSDAKLSKAMLYGASLRWTNLTGVDLSDAKLHDAHLDEATLQFANLSEADLYRADLSGADLLRADFWKADLSYANLSHANLSHANLSRTVLIETNLTGATFTWCSIYGISAWDVQLEGAKQDSLIITPDNEPTITVDNLKIAQFIYLLLNNAEIREVIDTITSKVVLILGRFTDERKKILEALRDELRNRNYLPVLFDFEKPASRDITETVSTLAHISRFVIADLTDAKSIPQELTTIVPNLPSVPVQPLILASQHEYGMFEHFKRYDWILPVYRYTDEVSLLHSLQEKIIAPAEEKAQELEKR